MKRVSWLVLLVSLLTCFGIGSLGHASADSFNENRLADDSIFENANTMNASQIDTWLNANFGSTSCISTDHGFSAPDPTGYNPTDGFTFGSNVTAGQIIYDAAQAYGINPQVLLTTLQKEQSLVDGSAGCSTLRYAAAAGYGCPDGGTTYNYSGVDLYSINGTEVTAVTGTCVNTSLKVGFSQQIIRAAWLLRFGEQRSEGNVSWNIQLTNFPESGDSWNNSDDPQSCYGGPMTQGTFARCPSSAATYYDGYTTIDSTSVHMDTGATAALYWYTPHFSGNQNFDTIFTNWFGSPDNGSPVYKTSDNPNLYFVWDNTKYYLSSTDMIVAWGLGGYTANVVSDTYMNGLTDGGTLSNIAKMSDDPNSAIYLLDAGKRYPVPISACATDAQGQPIANTSWAIDCFNAAVVKSYPSWMIERYTAQDITLPQLIANGNAAWKIENGKKRLIVDPYIIDVLGGWGNVRWMENMNAAQPVGMMLMRNGWAVKFSDSDRIYLYDNNQLNSVDSPNMVAAWGLQNQMHYFPGTDNSADPLPVSVNSLSQISEDATGNYYLIDNGYKMALGTATPQWPTTDATITPGILPTIPEIPLSNVYRDSSSGQIFTVYGSKYFVFPTMDDFKALGFNTTAIRAVSSGVLKLPGLQYGGMHLASGRLYKISTDINQIYVVSGSTSLYVNSTDYPGLPYDKLITVDPTTAARYPVAGTYTP